MIRVICLEATHGSGKTELCAEFERQGFHVLDEGFLTMPEYALHPQSLLMETQWVCAWFERLLRYASEHQAKGGGDTLLIADRSPFSAVFYSRGRGDLLKPLIREHMREVREAAAVEVLTVHVSVEREVLWSRICERLAREPDRARYNEDKQSWMDQTLEWYQGMAWDFVADNTHSSIPETVDSILGLVGADKPGFEDSCARIRAASPRLSARPDVEEPEASPMALRSRKSPLSFSSTSSEDSFSGEESAADTSLESLVLS